MDLLRPRPLVPWFAALLCGALACQEPAETVCPDAEARLGQRVCVHEVPDDPTWTSIGIPAAAVDQARATAYLVPARDDARLAPLFVDASAFEDPEQSLHYKFLTGSFPEFASLQYDDYLALVLDPDSREWFAGSLTEYVDADQGSLFGVTIWDQGADPDATIPCARFQEVHGIVESRVAVGPVVVVPAGDLQRQTLETCDVPTADPSTALDYEAYTQGRG